MIEFQFPTYAPPLRSYVFGFNETRQKKRKKLTRRSPIEFAPSRNVFMACSAEINQYRGKRKFISSQNIKNRFLIIQDIRITGG